MNTHRHRKIERGKSVKKEKREKKKRKREKEREQELYQDFHSRTQYMAS